DDPGAQGPRMATVLVPGQAEHADVVSETSGREDPELAFLKGVSRCRIEARANVAFEYPGRTLRMAQNGMHLFQGIGARALPAEAVGVGFRRTFENGIQAEQVERLHRPVRCRGHA